MNDDALDDDTIQRLMGTTITMLNSYLPAVLSVIYGNELPKDAIRCVEAGWRGMNDPEADDSETSE